MRVPIYRSSVGQKLFVGATGLFLCTFLVVHLSGNLLLFRADGGAAFEKYSELMSTNPIIRTLEIVLAAGFLVHILFGAWVWLAGRRARPDAYAVNRASENSSLASRWMHVTGSVVLVFLVVHLRTFFVPVRFAAGAKPSMYELVQTAFSSPLYSGFYLLSLVLLSYHLRHGFQSAFQTFGLRPRLRRFVDLVAILFWLVIPLGFASMPLYFLWVHFRAAG